MAFVKKVTVRNGNRKTVRAIVSSVGREPNDSDPTILRSYACYSENSIRIEFHRRLHVMGSEDDPGLPGGVLAIARRGCVTGPTQAY